MTEDAKQVEKKEGTGKIAPVLFKLALGSIFLVLGGLAIYSWWGALMTLAKGCAGPFLILAGAITLAIAKE